MKMSFLGSAMLGLTGYAVIVLMGAILVRTIQLERERVTRAEDPITEEVRAPLPAGPRKFQQPNN